MHCRGLSAVAFCPALDSGGSSSHQADNLWETRHLNPELWRNSVTVLDTDAFEVRKKHTRSIGSLSVGFGIRMSQLDARMCKIMSQAAPC